ncbi:MAG: hypothetical protein GXP49_09130 [Deltaproteobacteria bacterium]|nr:hypothetical protein [Deltaproteobacteria bacterium]
MYRHTQVGKTMLWIMAATEAVIFGIYMKTFHQPVMLIVLLVVPLIILLFGWLTIEIDGNRLRWIFGIGLVRKSYKLADIKGAKAVRNNWIWGYGIHLTPHGWLYNVSGLDAVEVELKNKKKFRLGTDDPQGLENALKQSIGHTMA